jgi:uncharacterized OB-fold protein
VTAAVVEGLFSETPDGPRLLGSRCGGCGTVYFPKASICRSPECKGGVLDDAQFGPRGTLWSYTVQHYPPPPPVKYDEPFVPYALGLVDLPEGLRVLSRVFTADIGLLKAGTELTLVLEPLCRDNEGNDVISFQFRPIERSEAART